MKNKILIKPLMMLIVMTIFISVIKAQNAMIQFDSGITVAIKTISVPPRDSNSLGNIYSSDAASSGNVVHRVMTDTKNKIYFGYDLIVEKQDEAGKFKVSIKPLSKNPDQMLRNNSNFDDYTAQSLPKYPEAVILSDGESLTFDILENPQTQAKFSDVIKVISKAEKFSNNFSENEKVKDFTINDVDLRLDSPEISINGEKSKINGSASGNIVWVYIYGKGRFIFSFLPQTGYGFQKTGVILDNKIMFDYNGESYQFVNKSPVLGAGGKWNLWVTVDKNYQPPGKISTESSFGFGAANKVEYLFDNK